MKPTDSGRVKAREAQAKRDAKEAAIREKVKKEMADEAAAARARALEELQANGGTASDRAEDMLGEAIRMLVRELPPEARTRQSRPPSAAGEPAIEPASEPVLSTIEALSLQVLQERGVQNREVENELAQLAARRASRKQASQLARDRIASGQGAIDLPEERAAVHTSLYAWKPPPIPSASSAAAQAAEPAGNDAL